MRSSLFLLFFLVAFYSTSLLGQWQTGWALDPHAGINSAMLQPAATSSVPYNWDVNLVQVHGFFDNDFAYLGNASALKILREFQQDQPVEVLERDFIWQVGGAEYAYDYLNTGKRHFGFGGLDVMGPAISVQVGSTTRIGAFTRARGMASSRNIDTDFSYYPYSEILDGAIIPVDEIYGAAALWTEVGFHLSQAVELAADAEIRVGGNFRLLSAIDGVSVYNPAGALYGKISLDSASIAQAELEFGFTNGLRGTPDQGSTAGQGLAGDLGVQLAWSSLDQGGGYKFVAGLSLLDLGRLQFDQTAELYRFSSENPVLLVTEDYDFVDSQADIDAALNTLGEQFYGAGNGSSARVGNSFSIGLPTTISAQFSYRPIKEVQVSAAYLGNLVNGAQSLSQGQQLTLVGHYSRWWYGAGLAISAHNWRTVNLGLQLRIGPIIMGSDRLLGSVLPATQLRGGDFYLGLKLHDFGGKGKNKKGKKSQFGSRGGKGKEVKCYTF